VFAVSYKGPVRVGRIRVDADPRIDEAVDRALRAVGWELT